MARGEAWRVAEAGHCDFENPTDRVCDLACGQSNPTFDDTELQETIRRMLTAGVLGVLGDNVVFDAWWVRGGEFNDEMTAIGALQAP